MKQSQLMEEDKLFKSDVVMLERAIKQGWDIPDDILNECPKRVVKILEGKKTGIRDKLRAVEVLIKMRKQNLDQMPRIKTKRSVSGIVVNNESRRELLRDERYLEYCRNNPIDSDAGVSSQDSEQGQVEMGETSESVG